MNHSIRTACVLAFAPALVAFPALAADAPTPVRAIAPDSTYVLLSADHFAETYARWQKMPLQSFLQTEPMRKVLGEDGGAQVAMQERLKELGVPEDSANFPEAFGVALYTVRDTELDVDDLQTLVQTLQEMQRLFSAKIRNRENRA